MITQRWLNTSLFEVTGKGKHVHRCQILVMVCQVVTQLVP